MIINKKINIKIFTSNRKKYEKILQRELTNGQVIKIFQHEVLPTSRIKIECICDYCGKIFERAKVNITSSSTYCNKKCYSKKLKEDFLGDNNPNPKKDKILVRCEACERSFEIHESKFNSQKFFLCSRKCYSQHRKNIYKGDSLYNYQDMAAKCSNVLCGKNIKVYKWLLESKKQIYCSKECYHKNKKETLPEKMTGRWFEDKGIIFESQKNLLKDYMVDFYLPGYHLVIEVNGDFWHANPDIYDINGEDDSKTPLHINQEGIAQRDNKRRKAFISNNFNYAEVWEKDIYEDINKAMEKIFKDRSVTTTRDTP